MYTMINYKTCSGVRKGMPMSHKKTYGVSQDTMETSAISTNDCTGSVPRPPKTEAELASYLSTYQYLPQPPVDADERIDLVKDTVSKLHGTKPKDVAVARNLAEVNQQNTANRQ